MNFGRLLRINNILLLFSCYSKGYFVFFNVFFFKRKPFYQLTKYPLDICVFSSTKYYVYLCFICRGIYMIYIKMSKQFSLIFQNFLKTLIEFLARRQSLLLQNILIGYYCSEKFYLPIAEHLKIYTIFKPILTKIQKRFSIYNKG